MPILAYYCAQFVEIRSELKYLVNFALQVYYEEAKREKKFLSILGEHERYSPLSLPYERYRIDRSRILTKITELIGRNLGRIDRNVTDLLIRSGTWRREQRLLRGLIEKMPHSERRRFECLVSQRWMRDLDLEKIRRARKAIGKFLVRYLTRN